MSVFTGGLRNVLNSSLEKRADITVNDISISGQITGDGSIQEYNVLSFGAIGDGVTDDSSAVQDGINYVKTNGGCLYFPENTYLCNSTLILSSSTANFKLRGDGPDSIISTNSSTQGLTGGNITGMVIEDLSVIGNGTTTTHAIAIFDSSNVCFNRVYTNNYIGTGILVYTSLTVGGAYKNVWIKDCVVDGQGVENNGHSLVNMRDSYIDGCNVFNILKTGGSPAYGVQLKNDCQRCSITNCHIQDCRGGIIAGEDGGSGTGLGPQYNVISDCTVIGCYFPLFFGKIVNNVISNITIDNQGDGNSFQGINMLSGSSLALSCHGNVFTGIQMDNILTAQYSVSISAFNHDNYIQYVSNDTSIKNNQVICGANSQYNKIVLEKFEASNSISVGSYFSDSGTGNEFILRGCSNLGTPLPSYTVVGVPSATIAGRMIYVTDETGGAVPAFSDGTNWRRVTDRVIIS